MIMDRFKSRIFALFTVVVLIVACGVQLSFYRHEEFAHAADLGTAVVTSVDSDVSGSLRGIRGILEMVGHQIEADRTISNEFSQRIIGSLMAYPEVKYVGIVSPDGILGPQTWPQVPITANGLDVHDREYFVRVKKSTPEGASVIFGDPVIDRATGERSLHMAYPVWGADHTLHAVILASLNMDEYAAHLDKVRLAVDSGIGIYTTDGKAVAHTPDQSRVFGKDVSTSDLFTKWIVRAKSGTARWIAKIDGKDKLVSYRVVDGFPFVVTVGISVKSILSEWEITCEVTVFGLLLYSLTICSLAIAADRRKIQLLEHQNNLEQIIVERTAHLEEAKRESDNIRDRLRLANWAIEQSPNMVVVTNLNQRILMINDAFTHQTGYSVEESLGRRPAELLRSGKTPHGTYLDLKQCLSNGQPWRGRFINHRADGSEFISSANIWPIRNDKGNTTHYLAIQEDITEQVRVAEELEQAKQAAERAAKAKGEFLANMSHEIRTPMNAIIGFTRNLIRDATELKQLDKLNKIEQSANHLLRIINDILDMSKIESGKMLLNPENVSLKQLMSGVVGQIAVKAEAQGLDVIVNTAPEIPDLLLGDALRISQCLINYATNAVKFTQSGSITLDISLDWETEEGLLIRFSVEDTGIGIEADALDRLFTSFEQADKSITRHYGGTGLGLALNKQFAELMGGTVGASSPPGKGSRFWFTALLQRAVDDGLHLPDEMAADAEVILSTKYKNCKILVVEDAPLNQEILADMLDQVALQPDFAANGEISVAMASSASYDVILMDMQMPVMDGLTATKLIRQLPGYSATPIIALTANAFSDDREACFKAGMNAFLSKPILPELLYAKLLKYLDERSDSKRLSTQNKDAAVSEEVKTIDADADMLRRCLGDNPWIDLDVGFKYNRKSARYIKIIKDYGASNHDTVQTIRTLLENGDMIEARRLAHSLKGGSAMLGIVGIEQPAAQLEQEIINGHGLDAAAVELLGVIKLRLGQVITSIETL